MSINGILNTGLAGMTATQLATQVSANNISNAATVGYTRRDASIDPQGALTGGITSKRVVEPFIQKRLLGAESANGEAQASRGAVDVLDTVFSEGDGSIGTALDNFQVAIQNLSAQPEDPATRQQVLSNANNLAVAFGNANAAIEQAQSDAKGRVVDDVAAVNQRLQQIGQLGTQIQQAEIGGQEASDLRDQRDQLVREVAQRIPVTTLDQGNGQMAVLLNGSQQLVSADGKVSQLSATADADGTIHIQKIAAGASIDVTNLVTSGSIGGELKASTGALADAKQKLDQLAYDISTGYNQVHQAGYGLDGQSGRNLFTAPTQVSGAAKAFSVSSDVAGNPDNLAAAGDVSVLPGDNRNALALSNLSSAPIAMGGITVTEALASLVGSAGSAVQNATQMQTFASGALDQVQALQDSTSGVSTDEEMVSMMKYQRAYEASLKVVQVADQMYSDLLALR